MENDLISQLSSHLFWDVDAATIDAGTGKVFIIQRVLEYGFISDWDLITKWYGINTIAVTAQNLRSLDPKALNFISVVSGIPINQFRCYTTKQLTPQHWTF